MKIAKFNCWKYFLKAFIAYSLKFLNILITYLRTTGLECIISCSSQVLEDPPAIGSVLTVKHNGCYKNGTLRHPYFWRERKDVIWENISSEKRKLVNLS